jgi:hypothetical protein
MNRQSVASCVLAGWMDEKIRLYQPAYEEMSLGRQRTPVPLPPYLGGTRDLERISTLNP